MTLSCGVNDVWHGEKGIELEDYEKNITDIIDKAQAAGVKVVILTSTMIKEKQSTPQNQKLIEQEFNKLVTGLFDPNAH